MDDDPRIRITDADLELLLVEADREDRLLTAPRTGAPVEPREALDAQILGGLVSP
jgi:hypothetical protein